MIKLISTDFDGTLFAEFANPPIPPHLVQLLGGLQAGGVKWVINTGRDMSSLMEILARAQIPIKPDYLVLVEREIHVHQASQYVSLDEWNLKCHQDHQELFTRVRRDLPRLVSWVNSQFDATVYEDAWSPFCLLAGSHADADAIHNYMEEYCQEVPNLKVMRNDVYARFCHADYHKGSALAKISRLLDIPAAQTFAIGDHLNDLPMLSREYAHYLAAPANAVPAVQEAMRRENGYVCKLSHGHGVAEALQFHLSAIGRE